MTQQDIENLKVVLESLEPTSELYASTKKAIEFLSGKTHFLFGSEIVSELENNGLEGGIEYANDEQAAYGSYTHDHFESPARLAEQVEGWNAYAILDHSEHKEFNQKTN